MFKKNFYSLLFQLGFTLLFCFLFLCDDYIFKYFNPINRAKITFETFSLVFVLSTFISIIKSKKLIYAILSIFCFMEINQLIYLAYFGTYLHPTIITLIFKEILEIQETGFASIGKIYYVFIAILIPYILMFISIHFFHEKLFNFKFSWIVLVLFLSLLPIRAVKEISVAKLLAHPSYPSIYNSLRVYSAYFFNVLPTSFTEENEEINFEKYNVRKIKTPDKINVVLIYGESFNYYNQGLYGYKLKTTPNLSKLAKNDKNFIFKEGIAGAVSTQQSIPIFFNLQREPKNYKMQTTMEINLFRLAKESGFKTIFISAQSDGLTSSLGRQFIDEFITLEDERALFNKKRDDAILEILKKQTLSDKNFIVLHQRNLHSPYEKNYKHREKEFKKFKSTYDNAMLYQDSILNDIIKYLKKETKNPFYLFITSDHNELTGQDGLYGHITLVPRGADVPIMLYTRGVNLRIPNQLRQTFKPTHNELGLLIAETLGYEIKNSNTPDGVYYINGNDSMARYGYIKVIKNTKNKTVKYETIDRNKIKNKQQRF